MRSSFTDGYKVVFLAFPLEAYGTAADKADLVTRVFTFLGPSAPSRTTADRRKGGHRPALLL
jgi:hypothetical protein